MSGKKIMEGLEAAVAYAKGDKSQGRKMTYMTTQPPAITPQQYQDALDALPIARFTDPRVDKFYETIRAASPSAWKPDEGLVFCLERCLDWLTVKGPHTQDLFERINFFIQKYNSPPPNNHHREGA